MKITRKSPLTGKVNTMEIDVTQEELIAWPDGMPNLSPDEREFIMTGYTAEDWDEIFKDEEE